MEKQVLELECKPGDPRPGDLVEGVIKGTGLPLRDDVSRWFGLWEWDYSDIEKRVWENAQPLMRRRIRSLYNRGLIRFGSCG